MTSLTIYFEGGGDTAEQKAQLRQGLDAFLGAWKTRAREKRWGWKLVACGGRRQAYEAFIHARRHMASGDIILLLVDSEGPVTVGTRAGHLRQRTGDDWDLSGVPEDHIHLMVQAMEAWIVADPEALGTYYGQGFRPNALPRRQNLEDETKVDCASKLAAATRDSAKGEYHKIRHASELLKRIDTGKVRLRCQPHAGIFFDKLTALIG